MLPPIPKILDMLAGCLVDDCCVISWLLPSMEVKVSAGVMFLRTVKEKWDTLKEMYINEKNVTRVFELYEHCSP